MRPRAGYGAFAEVIAEPCGEVIGGPFGEDAGGRGGEVVVRDGKETS